MRFYGRVGVYNASVETSFLSYSYNSVALIVTEEMRYLCWTRNPNDHQTELGRHVGLSIRFQTSVCCYQSPSRLPKIGGFEATVMSLYFLPGSSSSSRVWPFYYRRKREENQRMCSAKVTQSQLWVFRFWPPQARNGGMTTRRDYWITCLRFTLVHCASL